MFRRVFVAALVAGLVAGIVVSLMQSAKLRPLIAAAEVYEAAVSASAHQDDGWQPSPGLERQALTLTANVVIGTGFGLLLCAGFALHQIFAAAHTGAREGLLWGIAGFACFALAPALGLPPELPGSIAADLVARQSWWLGTAVATAAGLGLIAFGRRPPWRVLGVVVLIVPHMIGAPQPAVGDGGTAPASLAAAFAAASLASAAVFWAVLGTVGGWLYSRLGRGS